MARQLTLPDLGKGLEEAEIVSWLVNEGDHAVANQPLVSVETDKAVVEYLRRGAVPLRGSSAQRAMSSRSAMRWSNSANKQAPTRARSSARSTAAKVRRGEPRRRRAPTSSRSISTWSKGKAV